MNVGPTSHGVMISSIPTSGDGGMCEKCVDDIPVASPYEQAQRVYFLSCLETLSNVISGLSFLSENR